MSFFVFYYGFSIKQEEPYVLQPFTIKVLKINRGTEAPKANRAVNAFSPTLVYSQLYFDTLP